MVKKAKKPAADPSSSAACYLVGEGTGRAGLRYQYLLQDYEELLKKTSEAIRDLYLFGKNISEEELEILMGFIWHKGLLNSRLFQKQTETEAKKRRLQETKQNKLRLLNEVKFLRRRHKSLLENPSQKILCGLKKQSRKTTLPASGIAKPHPQNGVLIKRKNHIVVQAEKPSTCALIDLNQISLPGAEDMEFHMHAEPSKPETLRCSVDGGQNDQKYTICRDVGNKSNSVSKRKITWQDQVALKV